MPNLRGKTWTTTTPANVEDAQYWEDHLISDTAALKAASSVQSVNSITPDAQGNVDVVALPAGGTAGQVLTKQSSTAGDADWEDPASSGHTIEDEDGNIMPYQETLQFENAEVTNDSVNNKTIVDCKGSKGDAATITVGTVTTLPAGSDATVTNSGTSSDAVFDFGIPKGADGTGAVDSVNGQTGVVVLDALDVGALPDSTTIPTKTSELDNDSGFVTSSAIPTSLSELSDDTTHRLVTDTEKATWDAKVSEPLLKDTVGWVGKNELHVPSSIVTKTLNGITFTVTRNSAGEVTEIDVDTNGSASTGLADMVIPVTLKAGSHIINGCPAGGGDNYRVDLRDSSGSGWSPAGVILDTGNGATFTLASETSVSYYIRIGSGQTLSHKKFYPMIRDASITDSTFEPYHKSVSDVITDVYGVMGENGAKNKLPVPYATASGTERNGVTLNYDADGVITLSGTASQITEFTLVSTTDLNNLRSKYGDLIVNGCDEGSTGSYFLYLGVGGATKFITSSNKEVLVNDTASYSLVLQVKPDAGDVTGKKLYPMIRNARDTDTTYQPYAMTNRELTEKALMRGLVLTSSNDLNDIKTTGLYGVTTAPTNSPESQTYGTLIVQATSSGDVRQMFIRAGGAGGFVYVRSFGGNPGSWTSWFKFTGTVVS